MLTTLQALPQVFLHLRNVKMAGEVARWLDDVLRIQVETPSFLTILSTKCMKMNTFSLIEMEANCTFENVQRSGMLSNVRGMSTRRLEKEIGRKEKTQSIGEISRRFKQMRGKIYEGKRELIFNKFSDRLFRIF